MNRSSFDWHFRFFICNPHIYGNINNLEEENAMSKDELRNLNFDKLLPDNRQFAKFLRNFIKKDWVQFLDVESLELCGNESTNQSFGLPENTLLYSAKLAGNGMYFYILLESTVDNTVAFRALEGMSLIFDKLFNDTPKEKRESAEFRLPAIIPIVLYYGKEHWQPSCKLNDFPPGSDVFNGFINFEYIFVDINALDNDIEVAKFSLYIWQ